MLSQGIKFQVPVNYLLKRKRTVVANGDPSHPFSHHQINELAETGDDEAMGKLALALFEQLQKDGVWEAAKGGWLVLLFDRDHHPSPEPIAKVSHELFVKHIEPRLEALGLKGACTIEAESTYGTVQEQGLKGVKRMENWDNQDNVERKDAQVVCIALHSIRSVMPKIESETECFERRYFGSWGARLKNAKWHYVWHDHSQGVGAR